MTQPPKPRVFIGSSAEGLQVANAIQENLEHFAEPTVWTQGFFHPSAGVLERLTAALPTFDFGIFVFSPDDILNIRNAEYRSARDNVIFEMGLFIGNLGRQRAFFVIPRGVEALRIPTDLAGITPITYEANRQDGNLTAALGPASSKMRRVFQDLGPLNLRALQARQSQTPERSIPDIEVPEPRRKEVLGQLRTSLDELRQLNEEASTRRSFQQSEARLTRWKTRVTRFIDANVSLQEAIAFAGIHTAESGASPMGHRKSSVAGHVAFLEAIIEEMEADPTFAPKPEPRPSESELLAVTSFTYRSSRGVDL